MTRLTLLLSGALLALSSLACPGPTETPVDSGVPSPPQTDADAGAEADAGTEEVLNTFHSDAGVTFAIGSTTLEIDEDSAVAFLWEAPEASARWCEGNAPTGAHVQVGTDSKIVGEHSTDETGRLLVRYGEGTEFAGTAQWLKPVGGTVTVETITETSLVGSYVADSLLDQDDAAVEGAISGTFKASACPEYVGTGANSISGTVAFPVVRALRQNDGSDVNVFFLSADEPNVVCDFEDSTQTLKVAALSFRPADVSAPVGEYTDANVSLFIAYPNGDTDGIHVTESSSITVTEGDGTFLKGSFEAVVSSLHTGLRGTIRGSFDTTLGCIE